MKSFNRSSGRAAAAIVLAVLVGAGLSACGSDDRDDYGNNGNPTPTPTPTPPPVAETFYSAVSSVVGASNETGEPNSIDAVAVTAPETTEPDPLG